LALRHTRCASRIAAVVLGAAITAVLGSASAAEPATQRVEIVGRARPGTSADEASAVTVITAAELVKAGVATAEQALQRIVAQQSNQGMSQSVGEFGGGLAEADLRGLGADKTLVLLNGRRVANHAYDGGAVDLNTIPMAAIDRIEVQRDGASAIYGSDAISGVINFVLREQITGFELAAEAEWPRQRGGESRRASVIAGFGDIGSDGFNAFAAVDGRTQQALRAQERAFARSGVIRAADGRVLQFRTGSTSFPGDLDGFEPSLAQGCAPPRSIPDPDGSACRWDYAADIDLLPRHEQLTALAGAGVKLGADHRLDVELLRAQSRMRSTQPPAPADTVILDSSPYWLTGRPSAVFDGVGRGGVANWLVAEAGPRTSESSAIARRGLARLQGFGEGMAYQVALGRSTSQVSDTLLGGFVDAGALQAGVLSGAINPFGPQSAAGGAALRASEAVGPIARAEGQVDTLDARFDADLWPLPGGAFSASLGAEWRHERFFFDVLPLAERTGTAGLELAADTGGARTATAVYAALAAPLTSTFLVSLAARQDRYRGLYNVHSPKIGLRWQPAREWTLRASANAGFRAPTLYELRQPLRLSLTPDSFDDPLLCPNGNAVPGAPAGQVCDQQVLARTGGPVSYGQPATQLRPERSKMATLGLSLQPTSDITLTADLWWLRLRNEIDTLPDDAVFEDPLQYGSRIVRCSQLDVGARGDVPACLNAGTINRIAFVDLPLENLRQARTHGVDVSLATQPLRSAIGNWALRFEATYVMRYEQQQQRGGDWAQGVGRYADDVPIFRWQHLAQLDWEAGDWSLALSQRYRSGYADQNPGNRVGSYSLVDMSVSYTGVPHLTLTAGVKNLLDAQPPFSNQQETLQPNYDPRFTDPIGRVLTLRVAVAFD
jgi:iron complex outermembrane recepter protein